MGGEAAQSIAGRFIRIFWELQQKWLCSILKYEEMGP